MKVIVALVAGLTSIGVGIGLLVASQGCSTMGSRCLNSGATGQLFFGIALIAAPLVLLFGAKPPPRQPPPRRPHRRHWL